MSCVVMIAFSVGTIGTIFLVLASIWIDSRFSNCTNSIKSWVKTVGCPLLFTLLMTITMMSYGSLSLITANRWFNAITCSAYLVFAWIVVERIYELMDSKSDRVMDKVDKNYCHIIAGVSLAVMCIVRSKVTTDYLIFASIAISIIIGAYFPIDDVFNGGKIKDIGKKILKNTIIGIRLQTVIGSAAAAAVLVLSSFDARGSKMIEENLGWFGIGILSGGFLIIIACEVKERIQKQK